MANKERLAALLKAAQQGYADGNRMECPYLLSSESYIAFVVGIWFKQTGRTAPRDYAPSRGYKVRCNDLVLHWDWDKNYGRDIIERIA